MGFLYPYQESAVRRMKNGCILAGGVGSGKSRTALYYYFKKHGGRIGDGVYDEMDTPRDIYIITTAKKRDEHEWEKELAPFRISNDRESTPYSIAVVIDSWNNIAKYKDVKDSFFIFDEQRLVGNGAWVKSFLKIAKSNEWILLSATPGDTWMDYIPVFIANGFYKNRTQFIQDHVIYSRFAKFPKVDKFINTGRLIRLRRSILVDMDCTRKTVRHDIDVWCDYDILKYKDIMKTRWDPYKDEPIENAGVLCYTLRRSVNASVNRTVKLLEIFEEHPRMIIFYNFDYELDVLKSVFSPHMESDGFELAEWNGHKHQAIPEGDSWVYLVQYTAGCEGWNCIKTDTIVFYSQTYSYKVLEQARGRIDRINTPYIDLYYYHLRSRSGIDLAIKQALGEKKKFNETKFAGTL